jgi:hypothetical protein
MGASAQLCSGPARAGVVVRTIRGSSPRMRVVCAPANISPSCSGLTQASVAAPGNRKASAAVRAYSDPRVKPEDDDLSPEDDDHPARDDDRSPEDEHQSAGMTISRAGKTVSRLGLTIYRPRKTIGRPRKTISRPGMTVSRPTVTAGRISWSRQMCTEHSQKAIG